MNKTKVKEKEVTRVMTVRITVIGDEKDMMDKKEATKEMEELIKEIFHCKTFIEYYMPGELRYPGHGLRFLKE